MFKTKNKKQKRGILAEMRLQPHFENLVSF